MSPLGPTTSKYKVLEKRGSWRSRIVLRTDVAHVLVKQIGETMFPRNTPVLVA